MEESTGSVRDSAADATPVLIVDESQRCVEANASASRVLGLSRGQIVGQNVENLRLPDGHLLVLPRIESETGPDPWARRAANGPGSPGRQPSRREREILGLLARGSTDAQIADHLKLSPATVQTHVRNAKAKLGARTRAQAVALSLVSGLIELD